LRTYESLIHQPQGLILVTGPTGSGKTTTLYASLNAVKDETKNIVTVEDPIEYQLEGITQVQVNPKAGMTFASGLRSILRQDPNVILVGEIRDAETAGIAIQASETGHLVFSTLHTNDAVSTVNRLFNLEVSSDLVAANLLAVVAQRLVRRICPKCKTEYRPDAREWQHVGIYHGKDVTAAAYKGSGCSMCKHTGYYGQIGLYEIFVPTDRLREEIAGRSTKHSLKQHAAEAGMQSMLDDGLEKIRQGITTIEEVARVCAVEPEDVGGQKECPACGKTLTDNEAVCPVCQHRLQPTCGQCGASLEATWLFCPLCGTRTPEAQKQQAAGFLGEPGAESQESATAIRIVAADDDEQVRDMVKLLLETQGYQVIPAMNGQDALEKIQTELPDLVILDVVMPKLDGFGVCKAVRANVDTMFIPVVMLTGQDSLEEKQQGLSLGADDYITKPFRADELLERIGAVLQRSYHQQQESE
jgi:type IV pilus assembly protein PilB